jgi:hypothetical protein
MTFHSTPYFYWSFVGRLEVHGKRKPASADHLALWISGHQNVGSVSSRAEVGWNQYRGNGGSTSSPPLGSRPSLGLQ